MTADEIISSAANPLAKRIRQLADRRQRRREGAFVVHGIQPVWQAVEAGAEIDTLVVAPQLLRSPAAISLVAQQRAQGARVARMSADLFARLSDRDSPAGIAAIVRARPSALGELAVGRGSVFVALHEIGNPGNLGTIIRTADAAGGAGVILVGHTTDPYDPAAVKASMGALFHVPVARVPTVDELLGWARAGAVTVATTSARAGDSFWEADLAPPLVFLLGSEGRGLPDGVLDRGELRLRIPIVGSAESLNLAMAAGLLLYEAHRRAFTGRARRPMTTVAAASSSRSTRELSPAASITSPATGA
jgi:TrmH family RNA methyltransferase